jgi:ATP-binding cassette, subfamily C, bacterial CydD
VRLVVDGVVRRGVGPVSFRTERGTFVAITGPGLSGKSTLVGLVAGFGRPDRGRIVLDGDDLANMPRATLERRVGWLGAVIPRPGRRQRPLPALFVGDDPEAPFVVDLESAANVFAYRAARARLDDRLMPLVATIRYLRDAGSTVVVGTRHPLLITAADQVVRLP